MAYEIIPTPAVKKAFKACRKDKQFKEIYKELEGEEYIEPTRFSDNKIIFIYATVYAGYLLGSGQLEKYKQIFG